MKKENSLILGILAGIGIIALFAYFFTNAGAQPQVEVAPITQSPEATSSATANMNPNYADLTPDQIAIADKAIGHLLNNTQGLNPALITVDSFMEKDFSDASLGCPQPGQSYAQVITPGYQIGLSAQGAAYDYRVAGDTVIQCE